MKKRLLFCLAALGMASMLFGFDSAETADSVMEKMQTATTGSAGATMDMDMNMDVSIDISDGTTSSSLGIGLKGAFDFLMNMDPVALSMDGSMDLSVLGQGESLTMKLYGVPSEDGTFNTYVYTEDSTTGEGQWEKSSSSAAGLDMNALNELSSNVDLSEWGLEFQLAPEAVDVDGTECYLLSAVMDSASFETLLNKISEVAGQPLGSEEELQMAMSMLDGIKINFEYYVNTATYVPVKFHMDLNDSDLSAISQYVAMGMGEMAEGSSLTITLNDISIDATMAYGDANDITVPEEALAAAESGETTEDVANEVEDALEQIAG